ncbi:unnamed protein product, partial [Mesorhabditis spiculigera]
MEPYVPPLPNTGFSSRALVEMSSIAISALSRIVGSGRSLEVVAEVDTVEEGQCELAVDPNWRMSRAESACRLKLIRVEVAAELLPQGCTPSDLLAAVNVKEKIEINGEYRLVQKKKTIYPEWERCWDTAVTPGRIIQVVLMHNQIPVVEATMRLEVSITPSFR